MNLKHAFAAMFVAMSIGAAMIGPAYAANVSISIGTPPPAVIVEPVPPPRAGYVWVPGYWRWHGAHHVWVKGRWVVARRGYHYVPEQWVEVNGRWVFHPGHRAR
jgi:hypothetical protein